MMFGLAVPRHCYNEIEWVCSVVFGDFLGVSCTLQPHDGPGFILSAQGKTLTLVDYFFSNAAVRWLDLITLPTTPLLHWHVPSSLLREVLISADIPVLFGSAGFEWDEAGHGHLHLDVLGSIFFMLSRYEEAVSTVRDLHHRFPVTASVSFREGFIDRPIVDEYVEILWACMQTIWPVERKQRISRLFVTCDVDWPFELPTRSLRFLARRIGGHAYRGGLAAALKVIRNYRAASKGDYSQDTFRSAIDWMMDVNEDAGNQVSFFFIAEKTDLLLDRNFPLAETRMRGLLQSIHQRGHLIGIHPGYYTFQHPENFAKAVVTLRRILAQEGIEQSEMGGRQHYLRWETPATALLWEANGLDYDSTLAYADHPGFRCGTCHEYFLYDVVQRKPLKLRERPLILMECSVIAPQYLGLGYGDETLATMLRYKEICRKFCGTFTLLWHNSHFNHPMDRVYYQELIRN